MTYPTIMPALTLDFQNSQQLDPRVTFSRSSGATYINSAGSVVSAADHEPRFDHDPVTGESLGLLVEESRTNLAENSEDFSLWTTVNSTLLTAQGTAPNGTNTAFKIQENTSSASHSIREPSNSSWSGTATLSCYVKPAGRNFAYMGFTGVSQTSITFDLVNKVSSYQGNNVTSGSVEDAGNGWLRIVAVFSSSITSGPATVGPAESDSGGGLNYTGDGSSGILAWGAQLEEGPFPSSYIPTAGATATRSEDIAQVDTADIYGDEFTIINKPFGVSSGSDTLHLKGYPHAERAVVYNENLSQEQINAVTNQEDDEFWRWRVLGSSFALPNFATDGQVTVDWGDGTVEVLTTAEHTFTNGSGYHDIGFRLDSGTYYFPYIHNNANIREKVISTGPAPESMRFYPQRAFNGCTNLQAFDATVDIVFPDTRFDSGWQNCSSLNSFPLIDTSSGTNFTSSWANCSSLTSFPLLDTSSGTLFFGTWSGCSSLASFPPIDTSLAVDMARAFSNCSSLTSLPLLDTSGCFGTFTDTWINCYNLTSFPAIVCNGSSYNEAWRGCINLATFPANMFDSTPITEGKGHGSSWSGAWRDCALTAQSIENILVSLDTNGAQNCEVAIQGGTNAAQSTWSAAANTALSSLQAKGWTVNYNP